MLDAEKQNNLSELKSKLSTAYRTRGAEALIDAVALLSQKVELNSRPDHDNEILHLTNLVEAQDRRIKVLESAINAMSGYPGPLRQKFVKKVMIDAHAPLETTSNFHQLEYDKRGTAYRWTGPGAQFSVNLSLDRSEARQLALNICSFSTRLPPKKAIFGWLDGKEIEWSDVTKGSGIITYLFEVPENPGSPNLTSCVFESSNVWTPAEEIENSSDKRQLGVAFHSLISL